MKRYFRPSRRVSKSRRWVGLRVEALRRDRWCCVFCGARGRLEVDHIKPVRDYPELAYSLENLQTLCPSCHTRKTRADIGQPIREDLEAWRKFARELYGR